MMESAEMFASNIFKSALDLIMSVSWIAITVVVLVAAVTYFFRRYTIMCIGRKLNARSDWMPFVPIACSIYELRMLHESPWKVFFFKDIGFAFALLVGNIISAIFLAVTKSVSVSVTMGALLGLAYAGYTLYITYSWYRRLYAKFDFNPMLAVMQLVPGISAIASGTIDLLMAYDNGKPLTPFIKKVAGDGTIKPPLPPKNGVIEGLNGMYKGARFKLSGGESIVLGRDSTQCNLVFDQFNAEISNVHCRITYNDMSGYTGGESGYTVTDYSKNGTFVDGSKQRLQSGVPVSLPKGTKIYLATEKNMFLLN